MKKIDGGGQAYPLISWKSPDGMFACDVQRGMSLRQWYAGQALAGLVQMHGGIGFDPVATARAAQQYADALIAELEGGEA